MVEDLIVLLALVALAVPVLLVVALVSIGNVRRRVLALEGDIALLRAQPGHPGPTAPAAAFTPAPTDPAAAQPASPRAPTRATEPQPPVAARKYSVPSASAPLPPSPPSSAPPRPNAVERALRAMKRWFTVGNVPVKIGMLVLLAGVAALLEYASDQGWLRLPIELRLAGVSAAALAALVFGWRQRGHRREFALALEGGAIGVLLLTVFAAFKLYALLPADAAFALSVVLIFGSGVLATTQDSRTLAALGILAGFLAPIWLSTGNANHVVLFSYYALLDAAVFAIAWVRPWRVLNLLGFAFTWGIGTAWGVLVYDPARYASTQPFLLLFFAFYLLIPILYARQQPAGRGDRIDGCLLFGTPLIAFALQAVLLDGDRLPLAFCALGLAAVYAALAWALIRHERYAVLGHGHALLSAGFATLAVPLALSARATASVFALEGAGLVWLGLRQGRRLPRWIGAGLQLAAAFALIMAADDWTRDTRAIANPTFMDALLIALAGFASALAYRNVARSRIAAGYFLWGLAWWCGNAVHEIDRFVAFPARADALLAFVALTAWWVAETQRRRPARALVLTVLAAFLIAIPLAFAQTGAHRHPFAGYGLWAWLAFGVLGARSLRCLRDSDDRFASWAQCAWWLAWPTALSLPGAYVAERWGLADGWRVLLLAWPWLLVAALSQFRWNWLAFPRGTRLDAYRAPLQSLYFALLGIGWLQALFQPGGSSPLPWLPVLNPLELAALAALALAAHWLWSAHAPVALQRLRVALLAAAGFALVTSMSLRAVHHWGGVPWDPALPSTSIAQTSLTVVWSVLGVIGWIAGSRRGQRALWLAGAVLMALVLAKLILVDRQHLGNLLGIGSFIAFGVLCTLVGYFAPAPPRATEGNTA